MWNIIIKYILFRIISCALGGLVSLWSWIIGLQLPSAEANRNHRQKEEQESTNEKSAHFPELLSLDEDHNLCVLMSDIWWRHKYHPDVPASPRDFLTYPTLFTNLRYLLRPSVSLYCLDKSWAYFVEVDESDPPIYADGRRVLYKSQFDMAVRVLQVSHEDYLHLAKRLMLHNINLRHQEQSLHSRRLELTHSVTIITGHFQCDMLPLTMFFKELPDAVVISQPSSLTNLYSMLDQNSLTFQQYRTLLHASIHCLCKPELLSNCYSVEGQLIKPKRLRIFLCLTDAGHSGVFHIPAIHYILPEVHHLYLYNNALDCLRVIEPSLVELWPSQGNSQFTHQVHHYFLNAGHACSFPRCDNMWDHISRTVFRNSEIPSGWNELLKRKPTARGLCALEWALSCYLYLQALGEGVRVRGMRFEDLLARPIALLNRLNSDLQLGLSSTELEKATEGFHELHQDFAVPLRRWQLGIKADHPTANEREEIKRIFECMRLPRLEESMTFPSSIVV